jgi:ribosome-binding ATPase YchF (GTP1/OBG family)
VPKDLTAVECIPIGGDPRTKRVTLTGNPNSGKTSLFNALTGAHQHVGNYPGVTVERKAGIRSFSPSSRRTRPAQPTCARTTPSWPGFA